MIKVKMIDYCRRSLEAETPNRAKLPKLKNRFLKFFLFAIRTIMSSTLSSDIHVGCLLD